MERKSNFTKSISNTLAVFSYRFAQSKLAFHLRTHGRMIASTYDVCAAITAWILASGVIIGAMAFMGNIQHAVLDYWKPTILNLIWILPPQIILFRMVGLYRGFWRFASIQDIRKILRVSILGGVVAWVLLWASSIGLLHKTALLLPYTTAALYSIFLIALLSSARLLVRFAKDFKHLYDDHKRVIIVGAGNAGEGLVRDLLRDNNHLYKPVAFVDDDLQKLGREIHGVRVAATIASLPTLIAKHKIDLVLIAIPSASSSSMRSVVELCQQANVPCYTLPGLKDLANGRVSINVLRSISLEDLLGRYPVTCQWSNVKTQLANKTVLVTGGGGSIGSELCRQIVSLGDITRLVIVDSNEFNLYSIDMELRQRFPQHSVFAVLQDVTDREGMQAVFKQFKPHMVFHAAAYKHVPLLEHQPRVAIYNNIIGTSVIAEEAVAAGVETFVLISTDKAVNPTNIMGATKRAAEYFCQNLNDQVRNTRFMTVRFGNVLDSAGSVIPLFRKQIEMGGPVTVTHAEITRFFMTIPEATQLILQAAFLGRGGEIFVLDMGDPIKIRYLAEQMIRLAGKVVDEDIKIVYTGLRPGEKLYEECFYSNEFLQPTENTKILRAQSLRRNFGEILDICLSLRNECKQVNVDTNRLLELLKKLVPEYQAAEYLPKSNVEARLAIETR